MPKDLPSRWILDRLTEVIEYETEAFEDYKNWSKDQSYQRTMARNSFNLRLEAAGVEKVRKNQGMGWKGRRLLK